MPRKKPSITRRQLVSDIGQILWMSDQTKILSLFVGYKGPIDSWRLVPIQRFRLSQIKHLNGRIVEEFEKGEINQIQMETALDLVFAELNKRLNKNA